MCVCVVCVVVTIRASGEESQRLSYLDKNKQFLITKNVPCTHRAKAVEVDTSKEQLLESDGRRREFVVLRRWSYCWRLQSREMVGWDLVM